MAVTTTAVAHQGLTTAEAERRLRERGPLPKPPTSRSYRSIAIANTCSRCSGDVTRYATNPTTASSMSMKVTESGKVKTCATTRRDLRHFLRILGGSAPGTDAFDSRPPHHVRTRHDSGELKLIADS